MTFSIRPAENKHEIELAIQNYWINDPPDDAASALEFWFGLFADWPEGFFLALDEDSGQIVGVASAAIHPPQWTLTNFFVHPAYHGQGVGRALFSRAFTWREGCIRSLVHASQHPSAQRLYMGAGMFPQPYSIVFEGKTAPAPTVLTAEAIAPLESLTILNALDLNAFRFTREIDHRYWGQTGHYFLVNFGSETVGYFCVATNGIIGPLVVAEPRWMIDALSLATQKIATLTDHDHRLFVPGANTTATAYLLSHGYRYIELELLLSSEPMPGFANVIFHDTDRL
jgi:GNAT superfamily N-acetyltransferase